MKSEQEIRTLRERLQMTVDQNVALGLSPRPQTILEHHAFELGRIAALKWVSPDVEPINAHVKEPAA